MSIRGQQHCRQTDLPPLHLPKGQKVQTLSLAFEGLVPSGEGSYFIKTEQNFSLLCLENVPIERFQIQSCMFGVTLHVM